MVKRIKAGCVILFLILMSGILCANDFNFNFNLPENFNGWNLRREYVKNLILDVNSEDLGKIIYRTYANKNNKDLEIILMIGSSSGEFNIPNEKNLNPGIMRSDSEYKLINIFDHPAIIERVNFLPAALSIKISADCTLIFESDLNDEQLINLAEEFLLMLK